MIEIAGYRIAKRLGGGSQSEVYAATCQSTGRAVVVKLYKRAVASVEVSRVNREFHLLRELADCGSVPEAIEISMVGAYPAIVTAFSEGVSVQTFVRERGRPMAIDGFLTIAVQLATTLAHVHAAHIVHKDIKPQNLIVDPDTLALRLIDFGIASKLGRVQTVHDAPTRECGSWVYGAPEQSGQIDRGIDFRTDLYAAGSVFYLLLTGQPPFVESDPERLREAHLTSVPTPACVLAPKVPQGLSRIVSKLLAKEPDERYQTALGLLEDLEECRAQLDRQGEISPDFQPGRADAEARITFTESLVGREAERRRLIEALERAAGGRPQCVLLSGPGGIGKSALVRAFVAPVAARGGQILHGKADLYSSKALYQVVVSALRTWAAHLLSRDPAVVHAWGERLRDALGNIAGVLPGLIDDFELVLGDVAPVPALGAAQTRARLDLALERFVLALAAAERPLVFVFDDLQWADEASAALFARLLRLEDVPLLLVGTHRDEALPSSLVDPLRARKAQGDVLEMALGPLCESAAARMLARALGRDEADALRLARLIGRRTEYNPFLIQRLVEALHAAKLLAFHREVGWVWDDAEVAAADLPAEVAELLAEKVASLDPHTVRVLQLASCVGDAFDVDVLARLSREPRSQIESALYALEEAALVRTCRTGYRFGHDRIREATLALFADEERAVLHRDLACVLLEAGVPVDPDRVTEVADHVLAGLAHIGPAERLLAIEVLERAAQHMLARLAVDAARAYVDAGLSLFDPGGRREDGSDDEGDWGRARQTGLGLHLVRARVALRSRKFDEVRAVIDVIEARDWTQRERVEIASLAVLVKSLRGGPTSAIDEVVAQARHFGFHWSRHPSRLRLALTRWWYVWRWLRRPVPERLDMAAVELPDEAWNRVRFVGQVSGPVSASGTRLGQVTIECGSDIFFRYGYFRSPALTIVGWAITSGRQRSYADVKRLLALALEWEERHPDASSSARARWTIYRLLADFTHTKRFALAKTRALAEELLELGDSEWVVYAEIYGLIYSAELGTSCGELREQMSTGRITALVSGSSMFRPLPVCLEILEQADRSEAERAGREMIEGFASGRRSPLTDLRLYTLLSLALCVRELYALAGAASALARKSERLDLPQAEVYVAACVALAGAAQRQGRRLRLAERRMLRQMERCLERKARFGSTATHLIDFVRGERLCMSGRSAAGLALLKSVARIATELDTPNFAALAHHRRGLHLLGLRRETEAEEAFGLARSAYLHWGASGAAADLDARLGTRR